jgi:hypothetical protein
MAAGDIVRLTIIDGGDGWREAADEQAVVAWARAWEAAWNAHDVEGIVALCHRAVAIDDPVAATLLQGRAGARELACATFTACPDFVVEEIDPPRCSPGSPKVLATYRVAGTLLGHHAVAGIAPTRASVDFDAVYEWEFRGGLLFRQVGYFNVADVARQLGVLPERGTRANAWLKRGQHTVARVQRHRRRRRA